MSIVKERNVDLAFHEGTKRLNDDLRRDTASGDEYMLFWRENGQIEFNYVRGGRLLGFRVLHTGNEPLFFSTDHVYNPKPASDAEVSEIIQRMKERTRTCKSNKWGREWLPEMVAAAEAAQKRFPTPKRLG